MTRPVLSAISPCFIVNDVKQTVAFYRSLGFEQTFTQAGDAPFFAIVRRDGAQVLLKSHGGVEAQPNCSRHAWLRWDAFVYAADPDALADEFAGAGVAFSAALADTSDGLRGFETTDPNGYVLFFGRPIGDASP